MLSGKNIVLGVSGGIACFKAVEVVSSLVKLGANVDVVMTKNAAEFVSPLTFQTISKNKVAYNMFDIPEKWDVEHVSYAKKADLLLIVPATANIIGKAANGIADDFLSTVFLACRSKIMIVPAMNENMIENGTVIENINKLKKTGCFVLDTEYGNLACGGKGKGRMPEPETIINKVLELFREKKDYKGKNVLITAGPTIEDIDPVRFITNRSTGKMGYAAANEAFKRGANVTLISGPCSIDVFYGIKKVNVRSAVQMFEEVKRRLAENDIIVLIAAVADYRISEFKDKKIKKENGELNLKLEKNPDIAVFVGKNKGEKILAGTCAETENLIENAKKKLKQKNMDIIMANDITKKGAGFGTDTNIVTIIDKNMNIEELELMTKEKAANVFLDRIINLYGRSINGS